MSALTYRRPPIIGEIPLDGNSVIEASAGTGKTFTIEHLVLRLLAEDRARLEEILIVTFTEKATADLRRRIRSRIDKVLAGHGAENKADGDEVKLDDAQSRRLEDALYSFDRAPIYTIHGFCQRTLSDLAFMTGAPFQVEIVDAREAFHDAFRAELREGLARDRDWERLLEAWLNNGSGAEKLEKLLFEAYRLRYLATGAPEQNSTAFRAMIDAFDANQLRGEYSKPIIHKTSRDKAAAAIERIERAIGSGANDPAALRVALCGADFEKLVAPTLNKDGKNFFAEMPARCSQFLEAARNAQSALSPEATIADAMLPAVAKRLAHHKRERGTMDYDDMLQWLDAALRGQQGDAIAAELRRRYKFALIDEFQDTDDLQWSIFSRVFVPPGEPGALCVIGDPKQAIYSFRGADVYSYLRARDILSADGGARRELKRNYRSTARMLDALNLILDQNAPEPILTKKIPFTPDVTCGKPNLEAHGADGSPVKPITLLEYDSAGAQRDYAHVVRARVGRAIAKILRDLLREGAGGLKIVDPDNRETACRTVKARDVYVLTRTWAEAREIADYLREAGVPYGFHKRDGLFQTGEANDTLAVLRAIEDPLDRSRRLGAWYTPFFAVPYRDLAGLGGDAEDRLGARLLEWRELAVRERFAELFDSLVTGSGLAYRELLFSNSQRELTNYEQILETLLEQTLARRLSLAEIIELLAEYVHQRAAPPGEDSNIERLESERAAVQIMTVHLSKGLEADVVVLYGGFGRPPGQNAAAAYHDPDTGERRVALGAAKNSPAQTQIAMEREDEDRRLAYVALTRARVKLYLPMFASDFFTGNQRSYYRLINSRLRSAAAQDRKRPASRHLMERVAVAGAETGAAPGDLRKALASFAPSPALLADDSSLDDQRRSLAAGRRGLEVLSYTALGRSAADGDPAGLEEFKIDPGAETAAPIGDDQLSGGRDVGLFLHEAIEHADLAALAAAPSLEDWGKRPEVRELAETAMRRHGVGDPRWFDKGIEIVFNALRSPIAAGGVLIGNLASCESAREMEFLYPIPEAGHRLLAAGGGDGWKIERGVLAGVVDLVFRHADKTYFADWKSDRLAAYDPDTVGRHVELNYALQAKIYAVGVVRMLAIRDAADYERRFGGILYIFLRGIAPGGGGTRGIYFHRPRWDEVVQYERDLQNPYRAATERG